jgi:hypothetical protein
VQAGAWNVGATSGADFSQWAGSEPQQKACAVIHELSRRYWDLRRDGSRHEVTGGSALARARDLILESETSCFLFWGDAWIPHLYVRTAAAQRALEEVEQSRKEARAAERDASDA